MVGLDADLLKAMDRTRIELVCAMVGVVGNIVLNILLIPRFGIAGAAGATVCGFFIYNLCEVAIIYNIVGTHPFGMNNLKPLVPTVLGGIGIAAAVEFRLGFLELLVAGILLSTLHLGSLIVTRSLDENDVLLVRSLEDKLGISISKLSEE